MSTELLEKCRGFK